MCSAIVHTIPMPPAMICTRSLVREERVRVYSSVFELINNVKYPARAIHMYGG